MKKNAVLVLTRTLYAIFIVGTIISLFIVYKDINSSITFKFLMGYLFFTFFMLLYVPFVTISNSRRLKWIEIRSRLFKFIALFALFGAVNYCFDYVFRPSNIDLLRVCSISLGLAFSISFIDVTFLKKKEK
ncbi:MAG TPA: hypothetical protein GX523_00495 [Desulfitobacterium dehalogenans]|uniref:Uncharacterized protein n=1 Tax=Desulfitobacterium dehalogenans TaxID=36854 RepID=A0A7C6Z231_9FIRM|nr:hypothetical protein [Desulfitobacterium dehalogenans]